MPWAVVFNNVLLPLKLKGTFLPNEARATRRSGARPRRPEGFRPAPIRANCRAACACASRSRARSSPSRRLLLMDEPFAALDEITRFKLNNDLLQIWQALRTTVVFVTHSVFELVYLSNRVVVMAARPGRVFTELKIDAPYPRDQNFRTSAEYAAFCRQASEALAQAMAAGGES